MYNTANKSKLNMCGSLGRIDSRNLIERYCNIANLLPAHKRLLFHLYYKHGYSLIEISQLVMLHHTTVSRRLRAICDEMNNMMRNDDER